MQHVLTQLDHGLEFIGGDPSADFTNTRSGRYEPPGHEHIQTYADLVEFARQAGVLSSVEAKRLVAAAEAHPVKATEVHRRAIALREAVWRVFATLARNGTPASGDIDLISRETADAFVHSRIVRAGTAFDWAYRVAADLARPLWPIARAASQLLTDDRAHTLIRECADDTCAWLFVDRTKNHSRRWCDMNGCGGRNKMRALRQRRAQASQTRR